MMKHKLKLWNLLLNFFQSNNLQFKWCHKVETQYYTTTTLLDHFTNIQNNMNNKSNQLVKISKEM